MHSLEACPYDEKILILADSHGNGWQGARLQFYSDKKCQKPISKVYDFADHTGSKTKLENFELGKIL